MLTTLGSDTDATTATSGPSTLDGTSTSGGTDDGTQGTGPVFEPVCGDGIIEGQEECDLGDQNGKGDYCTDECLANVCGDGYLGPGEACDDGNLNDEDQCTTQCGLASCGDGAVQLGEECDEGQNNSLTGSCLPSCIMASCGDQQIHAGVETCDSNNTGNASCASEGFDRGVLECSADCMSFDTSNCHACGNNVIESNEICDNNNFQGANCGTYAGPGEAVSGGSLLCVDNCMTISASGCTYCGDDVHDGPAEACDGSDLAGQNCGTQGFVGGTLECANDCGSFDTSGCNNCGNGVIDPGETCDGGTLGGATCMGQGYFGGNLGCANDCGSFDESGCTNCGNGMVDPGEQCDGMNLGGANDCAQQEGPGHIGEPCTSACTLDYTVCCLDLGEECGSSADCCSNNCTGGTSGSQCT